MYDEDVITPDILDVLDPNLTIAERLDRRFPQRDAGFFANFFSQRTICATGKNLQLAHSKPFFRVQVSINRTVDKVSDALLS